MDGIKVVLDDDLTQAKGIVAGLENLRRQQEEAEKRAQKEIRSHHEDKQRIRALEAEQTQAILAAEGEAKGHELTKQKLDKEERHHHKTRLALQEASDGVVTMRMQMDALKVEMEAQRKAFTINVNWAARCTELKTRFDQSLNEFDQLLDIHCKAKSDTDAALRSQEEFRTKHQAHLDAYAATQAEIARIQEKMIVQSQVSEDVAAKLAELDEFRAKREQELVQKKLGSQKALSVLQRSLAKGDAGLKTASFTGWATLTQTEKQNRLRKDRAMKSAMKTIGNEGTALVAQVFKEWVADVDRTKRAALAAAQQRLENANAGANSMEGRSRALAQLEKQFAGEDASLVKTCFQGWANGQIARKKKEQNHKKASRMIANSGIAVVAECFGPWNELAEKTRRKKKEHEGNVRAAGRLIANNDRLLQQEIVAAWWGMIEDIRRERKDKQAGTAKAMRMMANSGVALMNLCFDSWAVIRLDHKKKEAGNKKALRMMANSGQALIITCWQGWAKARETQKSKGASTAKAMRMISNSSEALTAMVFQSWSADVRNNKDKNKKMRALEKSFGAQDSGKKMVVLTSWHNFAAVEGRKKRAAERSMKTAMKSITGNQDLLQCHLFLAWARYASGDRLNKLQSELDAMDAKVADAVAAAKLAVEEDLVRSQTDVVSATAELEALKAQREEAISKIDTLQTRLENSGWVIEDYDRQAVNINKELEQSRSRAADIGQELAKLGVYIASHAPRKLSRGGSGSDSRPRSGNSASRDDKLPRINGSNSRPLSGNITDGSKSARGIPGEQGALGLGGGY